MKKNNEEESNFFLVFFISTRKVNAKSTREALSATGLQHRSEKNDAEAAMDDTK